jgi:hypothetical protein
MNSYKKYAYTASGMQGCVKIAQQNMANLSFEIDSYESALGPMVSQIHALSASVKTYLQLNLHIENVYRPTMLKHVGAVAKRDTLYKTLEDMQAKMLEPQFLADLGTEMAAEIKEASDERLIAEAMSKATELAGATDEGLTREEKLTKTNAFIRGVITPMRLYESDCMEKPSCFEVGSIAMVPFYFGQRSMAVMWRNPAIVLKCTTGSNAERLCVVCYIGDSSNEIVYDILDEACMLGGPKVA